MTGNEIDLDLARANFAYRLVSLSSSQSSAASLSPLGTSYTITDHIGTLSSTRNRSQSLGNAYQDQRFGPNVDVFHLDPILSKHRATDQHGIWRPRCGRQSIAEGKQELYRMQSEGQFTRLRNACYIHG